MEMRWSRIRRRITRELDIQIMDWREVTLDKLLSSAWDKFKIAEEQGQKIALTGDYEEWVRKALEEHVTIKPVLNEMD